MAEAPNEEENGGSNPTPRSDAATRLAARRAAKAAAKAAKKGTAPILPGQVAKKVEAARSFYEDNARLLLVGIGAGLIAAVAWMMGSDYLSKKSGEEASKLYLGVEAANGTVLAAGEEPPEDAIVESFASAKTRAEKTREAFASAIKAYPDTAVSRWATLGEANAQLQLGKYPEAAKLFESALADTESPGFVRARATEGLGFALEAQQKPAEALKRFDQLAELDKGAYKPLADYHRARMYLALGQKQKAADVLEALVKAERARPPTEPTRYEAVVGDAEGLLTELSVELNAPKLRADIPSSGSSRGPMMQQPGNAGGTGLTQEIVDALRKQLESGKGSNGVSKDVLDQLQQQVNSGGGSSTTVKIPVGESTSGKGAPAGKKPPAEPKQ